MDATEHRLDRLDEDMREVKTTLATVAEQVTIHVTKCEERKERSDKSVKWIITGICSWFGVETLPELFAFLAMLFGG